MNHSDIRIGTIGFGDTNWTEIISILLRMGGWKGCIDIEGWHDPVYREDLERTAQVHAAKCYVLLNQLSQSCLGFECIHFAGD